MFKKKYKNINKVCILFFYVTKTKLDMLKLKSALVLVFRDLEGIAFCSGIGNHGFIIFILKDQGDRTREALED